VKRRQLVERPNGLDEAIVGARRFCEAVAAVQDPVPDGVHADISHDIDTADRGVVVADRDIERLSGEPALPAGRDRWRVDGT
jgi:hypothetical protein